MINSVKVDVGVTAFFDGEEVVIDVDVGDQILGPVRFSIDSMAQDYIQYNADMFTSTIPDRARREAMQLVGTLRAAAQLVETSIETI
jgi:hypothetical protein